MKKQTVQLASQATVLFLKILLYIAEEFHICVCVCVSLSVVVNSLQLMDCTVSFVHGILQARILEWVAISFSRE